MKIQNNAPTTKQKDEQLKETTMKPAYKPTSPSGGTKHHFV